MNSSSDILSPEVGPYHLYMQHAVDNKMVWNPDMESLATEAALSQSWKNMMWACMWGDNGEEARSLFKEWQALRDEERKKAVRQREADERPTGPMRKKPMRKKPMRKKPVR